jgi:hypothetical protein
VHQVCHHVEGLAVHAFLGRAVKMELDQIVGLAEQADAAAADLDLDGVAVVDDAKL